MPWIESHSVLVRHRKLKEFARDLGVKPVTALGHLHCLWHTAIEQAEDGDLSKWSDGAIADAAQWEGIPIEFLKAAFSSKFIDKNMIIHDWLDYTGRYLISKYKTSNKSRLEEIWAKFGRIYGKEFLSSSFSPPLGSPPNLTLPNLTLPTNKKTTSDLRSDTAIFPKDQKKKKEFLPESEPYRIAKEFFECFVSKWGPGSKPPNYRAWAKDFDLIMRVDMHSESEIEELCNWLNVQEPSGKNGFLWRSVTLSPAKLRENWNAGKYGASGFMLKERIKEELR